MDNDSYIRYFSNVKNLLNERLCKLFISFRQCRYHDVVNNLLKALHYVEKIYVGAIGCHKVCRTTPLDIPTKDAFATCGLMGRLSVLVILMISFGPSSVIATSPTANFLAK